MTAKYNNLILYLFQLINLSKKLEITHINKIIYIYIYIFISKAN